MKVKKAVILAAGMGTRMLPSSKVIPKEILPRWCDYASGNREVVVEEAVASGIEEIIIVISPGKRNHRRRALQLQRGARAQSRTTRQT